jgi:hypothetical protein
MGKTTTKVTDGIMSFAKAIPLIAGAAGGLIMNPTGANNSPLNAIMAGQFNGAGGVVDTVSANYLFYSSPHNSFEANQGKGIKLLIAGILGHKAIQWLTEA